MASPWSCFQPPSHSLDRSTWGATQISGGHWKLVLPESSTTMPWVLHRWNSIGTDIGHIRLQSVWARVLWSAGFPEQRLSLTGSFLLSSPLSPLVPSPHSCLMGIPGTQTSAIVFLQKTRRKSVWTGESESSTNVQKWWELSEKRCWVSEILKHKVLDPDLGGVT